MNARAPTPSSPGLPGRGRRTVHWLAAGLALNCSITRITKEVAEKHKVGLRVEVDQKNQAGGTEKQLEGARAHPLVQTAVDINRSLNGFYHDCPAFGPRCRLMQGGPWRPGVPGTLTADSPIVLVLKAAGFKWGGEEDGTQKDFMHISLTGY